MNKLITVLLLTSITACSTTLTQNQKHEIKSTAVMNQVEIAGLQKHGFCDGVKLKSYIESKYYYQWTCEGGASMMLFKEGSRK